MSPLRVGWIGAGIMGRPMAAHLMSAGHPLVVAQRASPGVKQLIEQGASAALTPRAVALVSDVVFTMLPDTAAVEAVVNGTDGVLAGLAPGGLFIDMSSIAPDAARRIAATCAAHDVDAIDAPVSGGEQGALEATLSIMAGGSERAFERAEPLLRILGRQVVHVGPAGAGQIAKACNQVAVAVTIEAVAEALALAQAAGVDPASVHAAITGGLADSRILERYGPRMLAANYAPGARAKLHRKDLAIATTLAEDAGVDLPALRLMLERYTELVARDGDLDHSAVRVLIETKPR